MPLPLCDVAERFLDHCRIAKTLSDHTMRAYTIDLAHAVARLGAATDVGSIDREALRRYIGAMLRGEALSAATVKRRTATLRQLFKWLEREDLVPLSPFHRLDVTIRLPRRLPRALSVEEARALLVRSRHEMEAGSFSTLALHFAVVTLFVSGLRVSELTDLRLTAIVPGASAFVVRGKGNRERQVFLSGKEPKALLRAYLKGRARLAPNRDDLMVTGTGSPLTPPLLRRRLGALAKRAGIVRRVTPHMLRHTAATQLIEAGVDIRFVQKLLGHASIATTQIYTQVSDASLQSTLERANTLERVVTGRRR
ncbi:MAG: tyrosine-type recombinase/integrase [Rhodospirillaceae bacterium]